jgi:putative peptidoglycan lipid II flippase
VAGLIETDDDARAWRVASTVTNLMLLGLLVLAVVVAVAAPVLVPVITPGFDVVGQARTIELTRIMVLSPVFLALGAVATSLLNAQRRFGAAAAAPLVYNLAIILGAVLFTPFIGLAGLALGVVLGAAGHLAIQLRPLLRTGYRYEPVLDVRDPQARQALTLMAPRALGLGASQFTFVAMNSLASGLGAGAITAFTMAFTLLQVPVGVIGVPLGVVVFPSMARELARGALGEYRDLLIRSLRLLLFVMLPIAALGAVLRRQVVSIVLEWGAFPRSAVELTANTLLFFLVGLAAHALIAVLARAFYARQDTRTPVAAAIVAVVVDVGLGIALVGAIGLSGLALAIAIGAWVETAILIALIRRQVPGLQLGGVARIALEAGIASIAAGAIALATVYTLDGLIGPDPGKLALLAQAILATATGGATFVGISLALRIPELPTIVAVMADLLRRPRRT